MLRAQQSVTLLGLSLTNQGVNIMYRIQAHNIVTKHIEIIIVNSMDECMRKLRELRSNGRYGFVSSEYNPRGAFYR